MVTHAEDTVTPAMAERIRRWSEYINRLDASYDEAAMLLGTPYIRHAPSDMEEIAALVSDFGIDPEAMLPAEPIDERELALTS